jgi:urease accessory protein
MALPRATEVLAPGDVSPAATVTLDYDARFRRRIVLRTDAGEEFLLDLPEARALRAGEGLRLEDGRVIAIRAAEEPLIEVRAENAAALLRLAWHLGNRHLPAELQAGHILIREDHVIEAMLAGLGATLTRLRAPFQPEGGAYGEHNRSAHQHHHHHDPHPHDH